MRRAGGVLLALALAAPAPAARAQADAAASAAERSSAPVAQAELAGAALLRALRGGGYVVYFRHTATDFSKRDDAMKGFDDCANQRLLSPQGRDDARRIGRDIAALKLPLGEVLASPMCRTMDHATLTFGRATPTVAMRESGGGDYPGLARLFITPVAAGTNRWMVGHGIPFRAVAGPPHLAEGEAVVMKPDGRSWAVVARITVPQWAAFGRP